MNFVPIIPQDLRKTASPTFANIKDSGLTSGRMTYAGTDGLLQDSANLTFDGTNLTCLGDITGDNLNVSSWNLKADYAFGANSFTGSGDFSGGEILGTSLESEGGLIVTGAALISTTLGVTGLSTLTGGATLDDALTVNTSVASNSIANSIVYTTANSAGGAGIGLGTNHTIKLENGVGVLFAASEQEWSWESIGVGTEDTLYALNLLKNGAMTTMFSISPDNDLTTITSGLTVTGLTKLESTLFIKETASGGSADVAGYGQLYCKDNTGTTELWFVDDSGTETQLA